MWFRKQRSDRQELTNIVDVSRVRPFTFCNEQRLARVIRIVDGDTIEVALVVDRRPRSFKVRLMGIDTPELRPPRAHPQRDAIKREALAAKEHVQRLLPLGCYVTLYCDQFDKFGRLLARRVARGGAENDQATDVIEQMVVDGFAVRVTDGRRCSDWDVMWSELQAQRQRTRQAATDNPIVRREAKHHRRRWLRNVAQRCFCACKTAD